MPPLDTPNGVCNYLWALCLSTQGRDKLKKNDREKHKNRNKPENFSTSALELLTGPSEVKPWRKLKLCSLKFAERPFLYALTTGPSQWNSIKIFKGRSADMNSVSFNFLMPKAMCMLGGMLCSLVVMIYKNWIHLRQVFHAT